MVHQPTEQNTLTKTDILNDYALAVASRQASLLGRKEVFMGKAKFGIFGDGKEVAQLAMAKAFQNGDFRSGYYRDQTFMLAIGQLTLEQYFAQLYAHTDVAHEPASGGRLMNGHFATRLIDDNGNWNRISETKNSSSDISPTGGQMPRMLGLAFASKLYRHNNALHSFSQFSSQGSEVSWGTIGNASTSEGMFFETLNAAGVLQVPMVISIWDDNYGISVPQEYHTTKGSISEMMKGLQRTKAKPGFEVMVVKGWDYEALVKTYEQAGNIARLEHCPVLIHVIEVTQPQGHSTSGSHERYKSADRLAWEESWDCNKQFRQWILNNELATEEELQAVEEQASNTAKQARDAAFANFQADVKKDNDQAISLLTNTVQASGSNPELDAILSELKAERTPIRSTAVRAIRKALRVLRTQPQVTASLQEWYKASKEENAKRFNSKLFIEGESSALKVPVVKAKFSDNSPTLNGFEVIRTAFDHIFETNPLVFAIGEDVGKIGDVNQGFAGLQEKYGEIRISDTGIRECTIVGQGIGAALRGLRPIVEIQYLDYLLYAIQILSDDVACTHYRTAGGQKVPLIVRTRGHRLEGVWHSGSPMSMILGSIRGMHVLVPRNMTQAAGFYNTLLKADDPALVIECLNGYRLKEVLPDNIGEYTVPLGVPEIIREGTDITIVTYGSMCRVVQEAAEALAQYDISVEIVDVQTLLPFDLHHEIIKSVKKTNRVIFADEDVPGGATAFMLQKVLEEQKAFQWLDCPPVTITAKEHRPAYSSDGDYFSKPSADDIFDTCWNMMYDSDPQAYPPLY